MKWIKDNWFWIILFLFVLFFVVSIGDRNEANQQEIIKLESENSQLKKNVAGKEIEIKNIQKEKDNIATLKDFEIKKRDKTIQDLQDNPKIVIKTKIRYKTKVITKTSTQGQLWAFSLNLHNDFEKYVKLDIKERAKTDKIIIDLKTININSDKIISFKDMYIKKLKRRNKKTIVIAGVAILASVLLLK